MKKPNLTSVFLLMLGVFVFSCGGKDKLAEAEAFDQSRKSLQASAEDAYHKNLDLSKEILLTVDKEMSEGRMVNSWMKKAIDDLQARTDQALSGLDGMKKELEIMAGHDFELGGFENITEASANQEFWFDGGNASRLKGVVNGYADWANEFVAIYDTNKMLSFKPLAGESPDGRVWEEATFRDKLLLADLAYLEGLRTDILRIQGDLLSFLKYRLGLVKPESGNLKESNGNPLFSPVAP